MLTIGGVIALVVFTLVIALWVVFANTTENIKSNMLIARPTTNIF